MSGSLGRIIYQLGFECSPIIFTDGIASSFGGYLPVIAITESYNLIAGLLAGGDVFNLDNFFAHFDPIPGGTLANYAIASYPFANQAVAANAIIAQPLSLSLRMKIPVNKPGGHTAKLLTMMALQAAIAKHANMGGTYAVATPAFIYTNLILTGLSDISDGSSPIPQNTWRWDFVKPLLTLAQAQAAQSTFMNAVTNGIATDGGLGTNAASAAVPSTITGTNPTGLNAITSGASSYASLLNPLNAL